MVIVPQKLKTEEMLKEQCFTAFNGLHFSCVPTAWEGKKVIQFGYKRNLKDQ